MSLEKPSFLGLALYDCFCVADMAKGLTESLCTDATIREYETDHWIMLAAPDRLNTNIHEWIDGLDIS